MSAYPAGHARPKDKTWFATKLITTGIIYNTKARHSSRTSWADLPQARDQGAGRDAEPARLGRGPDPCRDAHRNLADGWGYYEELKDNGAVAGGGNGDVLKQVAGGEKLYGMIVDFMPIREKAKGAPVEFVFPKEGVSAVGRAGRDSEERRRIRMPRAPSSSSCSRRKGRSSR